MTEPALYQAEAYAVVVLAWAYVFVVLLRRVRSRRPDLRIALPLGVAYGARVIAAAGVSLTSLGTLRGGDEVGFLSLAHHTAGAPIASDQSLTLLTEKPYAWLMALQFKAIDAPELALRTTQIALATIGILLLVLAVDDLVGAQAARLAAWVLALEPASLFFASMLHKEPVMYLAEGLVVYGGVKVWRRASAPGAFATGIFAMAVGCLIALATRPYASWFLIAASVVVALHAWLRSGRRSLLQPVAILWAVACLAVVAVPLVVNATSTSELADLQYAQTANAQDSSNLALEQVDYSTRSDIITNLPRRAADLILRPLPWQVSNASQQLGVLGTGVVYIGLILLVIGAYRAGSEIMTRAGPLVYLGLFLLVAYALSVGNAGTGFRYRTHLVAIGICLVIVLRERHWATSAEVAPDARPASVAALAG